MEICGSNCKKGLIGIKLGSDSRFGEKDTFPRIGKYIGIVTPHKKVETE